jgi:hypothetical protein
LLQVFDVLSHVGIVTANEEFRNIGVRADGAARSYTLVIQMPQKIRLWICWLMPYENCLPK